MNDRRTDSPDDLPAPQKAIRTRGPSRLARPRPVGAVRTRGAVATRLGKAGLAGILADVREETSSFPICVVVLAGGGGSRSAAFLSALREQLDPDDVVWGVGRGPRPEAWEAVHRHLDLDLDDHRRIADALVADLLFYEPADPAAAEGVNAWRGRTRATLWAGSVAPSDVSGLGDVNPWS